MRVNKLLNHLHYVGQVRGVNRDTFALSWGGFDTHFNLKTDLNLKLSHLGTLLKQIRDELIALDVWNGVTIVISSEMGRTISPNSSDGTDHGWGGHSIVIGGQLNGGKILGQHPHTYDSSWEYNTGRGVFIPTTSFEAMWLGISQWFGVESIEDLNYVLPNINNFGCRLYSETDMYKRGVGKISYAIVVYIIFSYCYSILSGKVPGCGGDVVCVLMQLYVGRYILILTLDPLSKENCHK